MFPPYIIAAFCGLKDSINPCAFVTLFAFLFLVSEMRKRRIHVSWHAALFITAAFVAFLSISFDALMPILYSEEFFRLARKVYFILGILFLLVGALHMRDWWYLRRHLKGPLFFPIVEGDEEDSKGRVNIIRIFLIVAMAAALAALSTIWPTDAYILLYSTFLVVPGRKIETYAMLFVYNFVLVWPLLASYIFVSSDYFSKLARKSPSMVKITLSALTFSVGSGLLYIFH
jgi:cytochrome c biogenesis protein CcdA